MLKLPMFRGSFPTLPLNSKSALFTSEMGGNVTNVYIIVVTPWVADTVMTPM